MVEHKGTAVDNAIKVAVQAAEQWEEPGE